MKAKIWILFGTMALVLACVTLGCAGSSDAGASAEDSSADGAEPASQTDDDGDGEGSETDGEEKDQDDAVPVELAELGVGPIETVLRFSSNLEAEEQVEVYSEAKRRITELLVEEGDRVERGQVLIRLQDDEQLSALAKAKTQLEQAQREYERQNRLFTQELISEQVHNDARYDLEQKQIAYDDAQRELSYTEVRAPIAGTITSRKVNLGDQIQIGQHVFDIVDFESIVARVYVPEKHLAELRPGLQARLSAQTSAAAAYEGRVKRISPIVDPKSGTVKVTIDVGGQPGLRPGMYVDVDLIVAQRESALLVPKRAVVYDNDQMYVYRVDEERRAERVFIEAALSDKYFVQPRDGLSAGDRVVVAGQAGLKDGALVKVPGEPEEPKAGAEETATEIVQRAAR